MNPSRRKSSGKPRGGDGEAPTLAEWLAVKLDVPADVLEGGIRLDMRGRHTLTVHGCKRILDVSPCEIRLSLGSYSLIVCGRRLICTAYLGDAVGIEGCMTALRFEDGEVAE